MDGLTSPAELHRMLQEGRPLTVIDVRPPEAYRQGHIGGALSIPRAELPQRLAAVPRGRPVVTY